MADIVRDHRATLEDARTLTREQGRVLSAIVLCRTAALGGHLDVCRSCGYEHPAYNSCRNRHCPKCQALTQQKWIDARTDKLLAVPHFHVVFTLPSELRRLCKALPRELFAALFRAAGETLLELGRSHLRATLGVTMVLHTWTRELVFHPHVHAIVTAGGLELDQGNWNPSRKKILFPVRVMGILLRGKMMAALRKLHADGTLAGHGDFADPLAFDQLMTRIARKDWIVYAKRPFASVDHVLEYLGRYTHRVAISNSRLSHISPDAVVFRTKSGKQLALPPAEFLRRFVQHVLPDGFKKIRHFGLYAGASADALASARDAIGAVSAATRDAHSWQVLLEELTGRDVDRCPRCGAPLEFQPLPIAVPSFARGPP